MEFEENMYVRTKEGEIGKVIPNGRIEFSKDYVKIEYLVIGGEITKVSHNIIDLIGVGDYVNGHKVLEIYKDRIKFGEDGLVLARRSNYDNYYLYLEDIKSIVTKEQFESMQYRIGE